MDAKELFIQENGETKSSGIWYCGKCRVVWGEKNKTKLTAQETAEACCAPVLCACGKEVRKHWTKCELCIQTDQFKLEQKRINEAQRVDDWDGPIFDPNSGYQDGFFPSMEEMLDWYASEETEPPEFVFLTIEEPFKIDFGRVVEDALEDHYEDAKVTGLNEISEKVNEWAESQKIVSYSPDHKRVMKVPKDD